MLCGRLVNPMTLDKRLLQFVVWSLPAVVSAISALIVNGVRHPTPLRYWATGTIYLGLLAPFTSVGLIWRWFVAPPNKWFGKLVAAILSAVSFYIAFSWLGPLLQFAN